MYCKRKRPLFFITVITVLFVWTWLGTSTAMAGEWGSRTLKAGMRGNDVIVLQQKLNAAGFNVGIADGIFGLNTQKAVQSFQQSQGLTLDGIAGRQTFFALDGQAVIAADQMSSRSGQRLVGEMVPWSDVNLIFPRGALATVTDVETRLSYQIKRYVGTNHADCEPLTAEDTAIMKKIYGGQWSWTRRAIIVTVNGRQLAASQNGMPHASHLDSLSNNNFAGHFCIHFLGSKTHSSSNVDAKHQQMVKKAAGY